MQPGIAQISQSNIGTRNDSVASGVSDRYLSRLDEQYLVDLSKEIKGQYVRATNVDVVLDAIGKQKAAWRDQSELPLRHILTLFALILFLMRFISLKKIQGFFKR